MENKRYFGKSFKSRANRPISDVAEKKLDTSTAVVVIVNNYEQDETDDSEPEIEATVFSNR